MDPIAHTDNGCSLCPTRHVCLARDVESNELARLDNGLKASPPMSKGQYLFRAGDRAESFFVVRSGVYKTYLITASGDEYVSGFFYPGEVIGLDGQMNGRFPESAVALSSSTACQIKLDDLPRLWSMGVGPSLLRLIAEREHADTLRRINLSQSKADARVAGFIKYRMDQLTRLGFDPTSLPLPMSRTDLANHLGLTLESLSRVLSKWKKANAVATEKDKLIILRPDEIRTTAYHLVI